MPAVTVPAKRYTRSPRVFVCAACNCLAESSHPRALTCSGACRVRLHRHPELAEAVRQRCANLDVDLALVLEAEAVRRLRPDLAELVAAGTMPAQATRAAVYSAYMQLVMRVAAEATTQPEISP